MMVGCCAEACTAVVLIGVMRLPGCLSVVIGAWSVRCVGWADWVDCSCFLSFVFLGDARRLEHSPCNTFLPASHGTRWRSAGRWRPPRRSSTRERRRCVCRRWAGRASAVPSTGRRPSSSTSPAHTLPGHCALVCWVPFRCAGRTPAPQQQWNLVAVQVARPHPRDVGP